MYRQKDSDIACTSCHTRIDVKRATRTRDVIKRFNEESIKAGCLTLGELIDNLAALHPLTELFFEDGSYVGDALHGSGSLEIKPSIGVGEVAAFPDILINNIADHLNGDMSIIGTNLRHRYVYWDTPVWRGEEHEVTHTMITGITKEGIFITEDI